MRNLIKIVLLGVALVGVAFPFWPRNSPRAILERAIAAHGGEANSSRCNVGRIKGKGTERIAHLGEVTVRWEETFHLPSRYKRIEWKTRLNQSMVQVMVVKDGVCRIRQDQGEIQHSPADHEQEHFLMMLRILLQLRGESFNLSVLPDSEVEGKPVHGIKATENGEWRGNLFFDQTTSLLIQTQTRKTDLIGAEVMVETTYQDYQNVDGIQLPMRVISSRGGQKNLDIEIVSVELLEQLDETVFDDLDTTA